jgi:hypothetical protein
MLAQINSGGAELTSRRSRKGNSEEENATTVLHFALLHFGIHGGRTLSRITLFRPSLSFLAEVQPRFENWRGQKTLFGRGAH